MKINEILFEMSLSDAVAIFGKHGIKNADGMDLGALKVAYRKIALANHPDRGGDEEEQKSINAAYDVLTGKTLNGRHGRQKRQNSDFNQYSHDRQATEPWAWAGYSGGIAPSSQISRENYRDINYIKKRMWELSGQSRNEYTIQAFDGSFFRGIMTVYGSEEILKDMADAMKVWNEYRTRAIFVSTKIDNRNKAVRLIWLDGEYVDPPVTLHHESFNNNPENDASFRKNLPRILDQIANKSYD